MEKGCKNHRETLVKILYAVGNPCNIYRLRGNPIVIIGFYRNIIVKDASLEPVCCKKRLNIVPDQLLFL